jgi:hypothetical protein
VDPPITEMQLELGVDIQEDRAGTSRLRRCRQWRRCRQQEEHVRIRIHICRYENLLGVKVAEDCCFVELQYGVRDHH